MARTARVAALAALLLALAGCLSVRAGRIESDGQEGALEWSPPSFCRGRDCPEFQVKETRGDVELRSYKRAHWISTNVSNTKWSDAYKEGYDRLQKYVSGDNEKGSRLPQTNPSFTLLYVADGKAHTLQTTYTIEYFVPFELQEKPPAPTASELAVTPVEEQLVWVLSFGGFATEEVVIQQGFQFIDNLTGDGKDIHTEFIGLALYDQPARLVNRHNELWLWSKQQPPSAPAAVSTAGGGAAVEAVDGEEAGIALQLKRVFEAVVKRAFGDA